MYGCIYRNSSRLRQRPTSVPELRHTCFYLLNISSYLFVVIVARYNELAVLIRYGLLL